MTVTFSPPTIVYLKVVISFDKQPSSLHLILLYTFPLTMADNYPAYERPKFATVELTRVRDRARLRNALERAFQQYRQFTTELLAHQKEWVAKVREIGLDPARFEEFETEPCMNSPLDSKREYIKGENLYIYLAADAAATCVENQSLKHDRPKFGEGEVMAMKSPPYEGNPSASGIKKLYHKRELDLVTQGDVKHFIAISSTDGFEKEEADEDNGYDVWIRSNEGPVDIVAYGEATF